jgi:chromosome segregation ATPase
MADKIVDEKSKKQDIWAAYQQLLADFRAKPVVVSGGDSKVKQLCGNLDEAKAAILAEFETAQKQLAGATEDYAVAEQTLAKRKEEIIAEYEKARADLQESIDLIRKNWDLERADLKRTREREAEEYTYDLGKKRRDEEESFRTKWQAKFADLEQREAVLKEKETSLKDLETAVQNAPKELEKAVKDACDALSKSMKLEHDAVTKELRQQATHAESILTLKLQSAEATVAAKDKQIVELQKQLESVSAQLKDMAVTVIRSNAQSAQSVPAQAQQ